MRRTCALYLTVLLGAGCGNPHASLSLSLSKLKWEVGEFLWYKLEIRNEGWKALELHDSFWFDQQRLTVNMRDRANTYFIVRDENGNEVPNLVAYRGEHGEMVFWANDCGAGRLCSTKEFHPFTISARQSLTATPSIEKPVQSSGIWSDARRCDRGLSPADCQTIKNLADSLGKYGDSRRMSDLKEGANAPLPGYRVLDSLWMPGPGKYTIQAVIDLRSPVPPASADDELASTDFCSGISRDACEKGVARIRAEWAQKSPEALAEARRKRVSVLKDNEARLRTFSPAIEFEIVLPKRAGPALGLETLKDFEKMSVPGPRLREPPDGLDSAVTPR